MTDQSDSPSPEEIEPDNESADVIPFEDESEFADLDRLYRQALDAMEAVESGLDSVSELIQRPEDADDNISEASLKTEAETGETETVPDHSSQDAGSSLSGNPDRPRIIPRQIIEAALFVGGTKLTTRKLCSLLRDDFDPDFVDSAIEDLNRQYAAENRPYVIQFGEGGYRMVLRTEFDVVRNKVYGFGPREVKLSQEALEILSLVAYKQPVTATEIEQLGKQHAAGMLRQLLRRELITIERTDSGTKNVAYHTTPRFLQVFGLGDIEELPQADDLGFK